MIKINVDELKTLATKASHSGAAGAEAYTEFQHVFNPILVMHLLDRIPVPVTTTQEDPKSKALREEFEALCKPVMKFLCDNYHPHVHVIIDPDSAELSSGEMAFRTEEFIRD